MSKEDRERLLKEAAYYEDNQFRRFQAETGWEDWMYEYMEDPDVEDIPERESREIDMELENIFDEVHPNKYWKVVK